MNIDRSQLPETSQWLYDILTTPFGETIEIIVEEGAGYRAARRIHVAMSALRATTRASGKVPDKFKLYIDIVPADPSHELPVDTLCCIRWTSAAERAMGKDVPVIDMIELITQEKRQEVKTGGITLSIPTVTEEKKVTSG